MTNKKNWLGMLALTLIFGMTVVGCGGDDGGGGSPQTKQYQGSDASGTTYILVITVSSSGASPKAGDSYTLTIKQPGQADQVSTGTVTANADGTITLQASSGGTFEVSTSGTGISSITGDIPVAGGEPVTPGTFNPVTPGGGEGTFTLTDIPSQYNGKYVHVQGGNQSITLLGAQSINMSAGTMTLPQVSSGRVTIPMWLFNESTRTVSRYSGNANVVLSILFFDKATINSDEFDMVEPVGGFESVNFSNGSATKSWNDASDSEDPVYSGDGLEFTLINGGTAYEVSKGTATATAIAIPSVYEGLPVTAIANAGFAGSTMTSITIPVGVTNIGGYAFYLCTGLTSVTIPASVTSISVGAFRGCTGLTSITIPAGVTSIGFLTFSECTGLTSVTFATGSNITSDNFDREAFPEGSNGFGGNSLKTAYLANGGGAGTYTRTANGSSWTKQQ